MSDTMPDPTYPAEPTPPVPAPASDPGTIPTEDDEADGDAYETDDEQPG